MGKHEKKREVPLRNITETRRFMSRITNEVYNGILDQKLGGRLSYMCNILLKAQETELIEKRLARLEATAQMKEILNVTPEPKKLTRGSVMSTKWDSRLKKS